MVKLREYSENENVLEAANKRIRHVFEAFDTIVVLFSGGKDSLVVLHLVKEIAEELGHKKVNVVFRDEELIHKEVIDFVIKYYHEPWVDMKYFAVPLASQKYVLGITKPYIQWDNNREWIREKPDFAITLPEGDDTVFSQYTMDAFVASYYKGKIALVNGIRSSESIMRYRACVNKLNESYINSVEGGSRMSHVKLVKPIYDWEENDVFKYFGENNIEYCSIYDSQLWSESSLRVSTPIHAEAAKKFGKMRSIDPVLYQQVIDLFPEMLVQERYYGEYDRSKIVDYYSSNLLRIKEWIEENLEEKERSLAMDRLRMVRNRRKNNPQSYPLDYVFKAFMSGAYKREILPMLSKGS